MRAIQGLACAALILSAVGAPAVAQAAWSRSYVVEWFEPAMYFGGPGVTTDQPGTDCPTGVNREVDWIPLLIAGGMPKEKAERYRDPDFRTAGNSLNGVIPFRGPGGLNVYENPLSVPDAGIVEVSGKVAYGFNLDGDERTGFDSVDGAAKGIDNAFYKTSGCILRFRGPPRLGVASLYSNDGMRDGVYTIVLVVSGAGADPLNEPDAQVGIYLSPDKVVKDAMGQVGADYTFRVDPQPQFTSVLKARVENGVIESVGAQKITMRDFSTPAFFPKELVLEQGKVRFQMTPEGNLKGMIGGYRDWREHYRGTSGNGGVGAGAIHESLGKFQLPAWYRALQRNADGPKDPVTGERKGISTAYTISALKAFVVTPDAEKVVTVAQRFD